MANVSASVRRISREIVARRFAVDEYFTFDPKRRLIIEQAHGNMTAARLFQAIEQTGPAVFAETALGPIRRIEETDRSVSRERDALRRRRQCLARLLRRGSLRFLASIRARILLQQPLFFELSPPTQGRDFLFSYLAFAFREIAYPGFAKSEIQAL